MSIRSRSLNTVAMAAFAVAISVAASSRAVACTLSGDDPTVKCLQDEQRGDGGGGGGGGDGLLPGQNSILMSPSQAQRLTNPATIQQQIHNNGGLTDDQAVLDNTPGNAYDTNKDLPGHETDYQNGRAGVAVINYPDGTFDIKEGTSLWSGDGPLSYGPNGIHAPDGSLRYGMAPFDPGAGGNGGGQGLSGERRATTRGAAPTRTTTSIAPPRAPVRIGISIPPRPVVVDHRPTTAVGVKTAGPPIVVPVAKPVAAKPVVVPVATVASIAAKR